MKNEPPDELQTQLLSAYLDGELTGQEQSEVEQLLVDNAELRQVYDELRALRATFEAFPRHRVAGLSSRVLQQAERTVLSGSQRPPAELPRRQRSTASRRERRVMIPWPANVRPWIWAGLTAAAGLLILLSTREPQAPPQEIAQATKPAAKSFIGAAPAVGRDKIEGGSAAAADKSQEQDSAHGSLAAGRRNEGLESSVAPSPGGKPVDPSQVEPSTANSQPLADRQPQADDAAKQAAADEASGGEVEAIDADIVVVLCEISPQAAQSGALERLLADQQIALKPQPLEYKPSSVVSDPGLGNSQPSLVTLVPSKEGPAESGLVYVEAAGPQLAAALTALQSQREHFLSIVVQSPSAGPARTLDDLRRAIVAVEKPVESTEPAAQPKAEAAPSDKPAEEPAAKAKPTTSKTKKGAAKGSDRKPPKKDSKLAKRGADKSPQQGADKAEEKKPTPDLSTPQDTPTDAARATAAAAAHGAWAMRLRSDQDNSSVLRRHKAIDQTAASASKPAAAAGEAANDKSHHDSLPAGQATGAPEQSPSGVSPVRVLFKLRVVERAPDAE